jgi:hypothetical protein
MLAGKGEHRPAFQGKLSQEGAQAVARRLRLVDSAWAKRPGGLPDEFGERLHGLEVKREELRK